MNLYELKEQGIKAVSINGWPESINYAISIARSLQYIGKEGNTHCFETL